MPASLSPTTEKDPPGNNSFNEQFSGGKFCITPYYYQHLIIRLYHKLRILSNPSSRQIELPPRRMRCSLKRATSPGDVLFRFQRQPSFTGAEDVRQIFFDINTVCLCCVDNRIGSRTGVSSFWRGGKQPVFSADDKRFCRSSAQFFSDN